MRIYRLSIATFPDEPNFYVHVPARTDPSAAESGQDTFMVLVPAGHLDDAVAQDWDALLARARSAILRRLAEMYLTDLEKHLKFEVTCAPRNWPGSVSALALARCFLSQPGGC